LEHSLEEESVEDWNEARVFQDMDGRMAGWRFTR